MGTAFSFDCTKYTSHSTDWHVRVIDTTSDTLAEGELRLSIESIGAAFEPLDLAAHDKAPAYELRLMIEQYRGIPVNCQLLASEQMAGEPLSPLNTWGRCISECGLRANCTIWLTIGPPQIPITAQALVSLRRELLPLVKPVKGWSKVRETMPASKLRGLDLHGITITKGIATGLSVTELFEIATDADTKRGKRVKRILNNPMLESLQKLDLHYMDLDLYWWRQILPDLGHQFKQLTTLDLRQNLLFWRFNAEHRSYEEDPTAAGEFESAIRQCPALTKLSWTTYSLVERFRKHSAMNPRQFYPGMVASITLDDITTELDLRGRGICPRDAALVAAMLPKCVSLVSLLFESGLRLQSEEGASFGNPEMKGAFPKIACWQSSPKSDHSTHSMK